MFHVGSIEIADVGFLFRLMRYVATILCRFHIILTSVLQLVPDLCGITVSRKVMQ